VSVRDNGSRELLERLGMNKEVNVAPDAVFALTYDNDLPKNIQNQAVLSLRDWGDGNNSGFLKEVAELVDWLWNEKKMNTFFLPFQTRIDDDREVYRRLKEQVRHKDCLVMKEVEDYGQAMEIIARSKLVIGMRLHSLIFAAASSRPFVAISYSNKVRALVADLGMEKCVVDYAQADFRSLMELATDVLDNVDNLTDVLTKMKMKYAYQYFQQEKALKVVF